mgnify:CR=1 FL=1
MIGRHGRTALAAVMAGTIAGCAGGGAPGGRAGAADDTLRVGVLFIPTGQRATLPAVMLALEDWNRRRAPGLRPLGVVQARDGESRLDALARWQDDARVVAVVSSDASEPTLTAASLLRSEVARGRTPTPLLTASAAARHVSGITPWLFRVAPRGDAMARAMVAVARDTFTARTVAVAYAADVFGREALDATLALVRDGGPRLVATVAFDEAMHDLPLAARQLATTAPDVVLLFSGDATLSAALVRALRAAGGRSAIVGAPAIGGLAAWGAEFVGVRYLAEADAQDTATDFARRLVPRLPASPSPAAAAPFVNSYAARAHDAARLVAEATAEAGADRARLRARIARGLDAGALVTQGPLRFDAANDAGVTLRPRRIGAPTTVAAAGGTR